jgi:hypothetical protein
MQEIVVEVGVEWQKAPFTTCRPSQGIERYPHIIWQMGGCLAE